MATSGTPALDARLLVGHAMGIAPQEVPLRDEETVSEAQRELALAHAARRAAGEPVARIVGRKEFHGLEFMLSAETLVPRPETETLVDAALGIMAPDTHATIVDIGTGTGAILLSVLAERPNALGVGVDISPGAIATAGENAARLGLAGRALFVGWRLDGRNRPGRCNPVQPTLHKGRGHKFPGRGSAGP